MDDPRPIPRASRISAEIRVPSSKSLSQRYFNLALLATGESVVEDPLESDDTRHFLAALQRLGVGVDRRPSAVVLTPRATPPAGDVDCGDGGTMLRFLTAALTVLPGDWRIDGSERLRQRPLAPLVDALRRLGARIDFLVDEGHAPLRIAGGTLVGGSTWIDAGASSQYPSALLMAGLRSPRGVRLEVRSLTSGPYFDLTLQALEEFGAEVVAAGPESFSVAPRRLAGRRVRVEPDFSSACYWAAAATLTAGRVVLAGVRVGSKQGDRRFLDLLGSMGATVIPGPEGIEVSSTGALTAVDADLSMMPDQVPTLAALAPFCQGRTRVRNVPHLRLKESDRLASMAGELGKLGVPVEVMEDGLRIEGCWAGRQPPADEVVVDTHRDHRVAMSLAILGLRRGGVVVANPGVVTKSYPTFWDDLAKVVGT